MFYVLLSCFNVSYLSIVTFIILAHGLQLKISQNNLEMFLNVLLL